MVNGGPSALFVECSGISCDAGAYGKPIYCSLSIEVKVSSLTVTLSSLKLNLLARKSRAKSLLLGPVLFLGMKWKLKKASGWNRGEMLYKNDGDRRAWKQEKPHKMETSIEKEETTIEKKKYFEWPWTSVYQRPGTCRPADSVSDVLQKYCKNHR